VFLLFLLKFGDEVTFLFVDREEMFSRDLLAFLVNFLCVLFELFEFVVEIVAATSAASSKEGVDIGFRAPFVTVDTRLDDFIGGLKVFSKEVSLVLVHKIYDLVVFAYNHHCVFP
jgi:hypothetical protein